MTPTNAVIATVPVGLDSFAIAIGPGTPSPLVAAILPSSRSVQVGATATAFATIINAGSTKVTGCGISVLTNIAANFSYQATNPANQPVGNSNAPVDIAAGAAQSFVISLTPTAAIAPIDVQLSFACINTNPARVNPGLNTLLFSASATPVPDIVALAATTSNDGILIASIIPGSGTTPVSGNRTDRNGVDGIDINSTGYVVSNNVASRNAVDGINAVGNTNGGGNKATGNTSCNMPGCF